MREEKDPRVVMLEVTNGVEFLVDFRKFFHGYFHTHLLCHEGSIEFLFNDKPMKCMAGEFLFWFADSKLSDLHCTQNFKASVLLVEKDFLMDNIPDQNWSIDAILYSKEHPVKTISKVDEQKIIANYQNLHNRFLEFDHLFYEEALKLQMQIFILEMWHTFANAYERHKRSLQSGTLYERFLQLVQDHCMKEREVQFYAGELYITPKHLNFVCKQNTGVSASEWIRRYTKERILVLLQNKNLNVAEIADQMEFSSRSFFTRYVKKVLGVTPSDYRQRMD
ncbi:helix-turn-helix domain-containing protein [Membranihabitans maritimus]|uniref:helix-turn-helix domain-containing protein n=1 Tax=Membranihabitans maritimus TaxID=2904244 RepID=UPI001F180F62|nr:AraC family transcriptional regulator [Membranihabitans maritimus]